MSRKFLSFVKVMPNAFLREAVLSRPIRYAELSALYNVLAIENLLMFLNSSINFSERQQDIFDAEREAMQAGYEFLGVMPVVSSLTNLTINECVINLDRIDAICVLREMLDLEPIPPRHYPNKFQGQVEKLQRPDNPKEKQERNKDDW